MTYESRRVASASSAQDPSRDDARQDTFQVLALAMLGLGLGIGLVFPSFVTFLGVTVTEGRSLLFRGSCIAAGLAVGGLNHLLVAAVVRRRLRQLATGVQAAERVVRRAASDGDWSGLAAATVHMPTRDELGTTAAAFTALLKALEDDVRERRRLEAQLRHQAQHDPLTGLADRGLFFERAQDALARTGGGSGGVVVCFVDLDEFKAVNDQLGHAVGDVVLRHAATQLDAVCQKDTATRRSGGRNIAARLGGDEFALLFVDVPLDVPGVVEALVNRLVASLSVPVSIAGEVVVVSASVGAAVADTSLHTVEELLRSADAAMYREKTSAGVRARHAARTGTSAGAR